MYDDVTLHLSWLAISYNTTGSSADCGQHLDCVRPLTVKVSLSGILSFLIFCYILVSVHMVTIKIMLLNY